MAAALPVARSGGLSSRGIARALALTRSCQAVVLGPGLGQDKATQAFVEVFVRDCPVPLVIDADGLNALASRREAVRWLAARRAGTVLTPHPGEMGRLTRRSTKQVQSVRLESALALFPALAEKLELPAGALSGGQQQMLAVARGLMSRPRVLLLDEPSLGLAPTLVREIFAALERLRSQGVTVLLVEQMAAQALALADRAYVLERGRITLQGPAREVRSNPTVIDAYLGRRANAGTP